MVDYGGFEWWMMGTRGDSQGESGEYVSYPNSTIPSIQPDT